MTANLLPKNSTPFERSVEQSNAERYPLPSQLARDFKNPETCPLELLPFLAYELSVDTWSDDWSETRKRATVAKAFDLHRKKGTLSALKTAASIAGAELVRAIVPPSKIFAAPSLTVAQRNQFLQKYPELRVYSYRSAGDLGCGLAFGRFYASNPSAISGHRAKRYLVGSTAPGRYGRQAYLYQNGANTPLQTTTRYQETTSGFGVDYHEIHKQGTAAGLFASVASARLCVADHKAAERIFRIRINSSYTSIVDRVHYNTVKAGLDPMGYNSEPAALTGTRRGVFTSQSYVGQCPETSTAGDRLFDRLWLFDPSIPIEKRGRSTHIGGARLSMPAYHSEIVLRMRGRRPTFMAGRFVFGQMCASDQKPYRDAMMAVRAAKSARDKILVQTLTYKPVTAGISVVAGEYYAGSIVENV